MTDTYQPGTAERLAAYRDLLIDASRTLSLTSVREPAEVDRRHIAESIAVLHALEAAGSRPGRA